MLPLLLLLAAPATPAAGAPGDDPRLHSSLYCPKSAQTITSVEDDGSIFRDGVRDWAIPEVYVHNGSAWVKQGLGPWQYNNDVAPPEGSVGGWPLYVEWYAHGTGASTSGWTMSYPSGTFVWVYVWVYNGATQQFSKTAAKNWLNSSVPFCKVLDVFCTQYTCYPSYWSRQPGRTARATAAPADTQRAPVSIPMAPN